jgi:hypothetical protein
MKRECHWKQSTYLSNPGMSLKANELDFGEGVEGEGGGAQHAAIIAQRLDDVTLSYAKLLTRVRTACRPLLKGQNAPVLGNEPCRNDRRGKSRVSPSAGIARLTRSAQWFSGFGRTLACAFRGRLGRLPVHPADLRR